jgi:hypothetical protein
MMTSQRVLTGISMLFILALLAACGGGGGGGAAATPPAVPKAWGTAALIEADNAGGAYGPQIALDANGNALAVWSQNDGTRSNIWSNRFE